MMGDVSGRFHIFLSHVWGSGQDQMRVGEQLPIEMLPDVACFLDVDDLAEGKGAEYVDVSQISLVFVSSGYFISPNCMRELLRAVVTGKPIVTLVESEARHGGMTTEEVRMDLEEADAPYKIHDTNHASKYAMWELDKEVESWGYAMPNAAALYAALFDDAVMVVEWNRLGAFQDVTLRLVAEAMLPEVGGGKEARTYLQGELRRADVSLPKPRAGMAYHVYCSPYNAGAVELMAEVSEKQGIAIEVTGRIEELRSCERMLVYLTKATWTSGQAAAFAAEVERAINTGVRLLLCHEMPGVDGEARGGVDFGAFFACDEGDARRAETRRHLRPDCNAAQRRRVAPGKHGAGNECAHGGAERAEGGSRTGASGCDPITTNADASCG